jgi:predicted P-loop ATPase
VVRVESIIFLGGGGCVVKILKLPAPLSKTAEDHARADTERSRQLFAWALVVLKQLGVDRAVAGAGTAEAVHKITLDMENDEVILAIRDALYPANGRREEHFRGLKEASLKQILRNRFAELKKQRLAKLRQRRGRQPHWEEQLILNKHGEIVANVANLILMLREAPKWKHVLAFDEFNVRVVIRKRPPWGDEPADAPWTDQHETQTRVWFQREAGINPSAGDVGRAVQASARHNGFHPVRDYLEALKWDGVPRLDSWLQTYFHVEDSAYVRAIGRRYPISAVARIFRPGAKVDCMLGLEGPQGKQKSEGLRTLAVNDEWYTDRLSHLGSKDSSLEVTGVWIVEFPEWDALMKATASAMKSFLSRRHDRFRPPYSKHMVNLPRQCVFAATINPTEGGYLKDPTGARRYWPVACRGMVDLDGLERVRDQLWAEAVHRYKAGEPWWLETPELEALATAEQAARFVVDPWEAPICEWVGDRSDVSVSEVLEQALGLSAKEYTQSAQNRVARILTNHRLGFSQFRPRRAGKRKRRYQRDSIFAKKLANKGGPPGPGAKP